MTTQQNAMHLSLRASDLQASTEFYAALLGIQPAKQRPGYAKFELLDPPLVLSLQQSSGLRPGGGLSHLGIRLPSGAALQAARERVRGAGLEIRLEEEAVDCCFARQDKFWIQDPDGHAWEFYVFLQDVETPQDPPAAGNCCAADMACSAELC